MEQADLYRRPIQFIDGDLSLGRGGRVEIDLVLFARVLAVYLARPEIEEAIETRQLHIDARTVPGRLVEKARALYAKELVEEARKAKEVSIGTKPPRRRMPPDTELVDE